MPFIRTVILVFFDALYTRLPADVMYFEPPQLAYWDSAKNNWRLDAFTDSQYNEGTCIVNNEA